MTMNTTDTRGEFSRAQTEQLLKPVNPNRVISGEHVKPHLSQQDVVAHAIRIFGFGHFDVEVISAECLYETPMTNRGGKDAWAVGYRALVRLTVRDELQRLVAFYDGGSTGESEGQPSRADSHDLAYKSALSTATKRAAIHLGDQFGLSLYNKGQLAPLVKVTLVNGAGQSGDVQDDLEQQHEDGGRVAERQDAEAEAPQAPTATPRKTAAKGAQGTKRPTIPTEVLERPEPPAEAPATPQEAAPAEPVPEPEAPEVVALAQEFIKRGSAMLEGESYAEFNDRMRAQALDEEAAAAAEAEESKLRAEMAANAEARERERMAAEASLAKGPATTPGRAPVPAGGSHPVQLDTGTRAGAPPTGQVGGWDDQPEAVPGELNYTGRLLAATTVPEVKAVWDHADARGDLTTELRASILAARKVIEAGQRVTIAVLDGTPLPEA
jgi:recombination DNA repair RAD52 pathway protein